MSSPRRRKGHAGGTPDEEAAREGEPDYAMISHYGRGTAPGAPYIHDRDDLRRGRWQRCRERLPTLPAKGAAPRCGLRLAISPFFTRTP